MIVSSIHAVESVEARNEVIAFAADLFRDQLETWYHLRATRQTCRRYPPTWDECYAKSRQIRLRRERDATYYNDSTNPYAG